MADDAAKKDEQPKPEAKASAPAAKVEARGEAQHVPISRSPGGVFVMKNGKRVPKD